MPGEVSQRKSTSYLFRVPKYSSVVSPSVLASVRSLPYAFFYLPQSKFYFDIQHSPNPNPSTLLQMKVKPWTWRLVPWVLFYILVIGIVGEGSCTFVLLAKANLVRWVSKRQWNNWMALTELKFFQGFLISCQWVLGIVLCGSWMVSIRTPHAVESFNECLRYEIRCTDLTY